MNIGMLWFDNSSAPLDDKVQRAVEYYQNKYGQAPNLCFVHPSMVAADVTAAGGLEVRATRQVRPNHFWLGVEER